MYEGLIRSRKWSDIGRKLGVSMEEAKRMSLAGELADKGKVSCSQTSSTTTVLEATGKNEPIKTLEQLLKAAKVDLSKWEVRTWTANTWTQANGKPAWQVKAFLERVFRPDDFGLGQQGGVTKWTPMKNLGGEKTILYIPDCQIGLFWNERGRQQLHPYHDRQAMNTVWTLASQMQPDTIVILGDFLDLAIWSTKFAREPKDRYTTRFVLDEARWWLKRLRDTCPRSRIILLAGNHEARIDKVLIEYFQEIHSLGTLNIPALLTLDTFGIEFSGPYGKEQMYLMGDRIMVEHGSIVRPGGGATAAAILKSSTTHVVHGHTHRVESGSRTIHQPGSGVKVITAMSPGCLCRIDGTVPGSDRPDWAHGYGWTVQQDGHLFTSATLVQDGTTITPLGHPLHADDPLPQIIKELGHPLV